MSENPNETLDRAARAAAVAFAEAGWTWALPGSHVPTEREICSQLAADIARLACRHFIDENWLQIESGRLMVHRNEGGDYDLYLNLGTLFREDLERWGLEGMA